MKRILKRFFVVLLLILFAGAFVMSYSAKAKDDEKLQTVFHVYVDDQYYGIVSKPEVVDQIIKEKQKDFQQINPNIRGAVSNKIVYVPEEVFQQANLESESEVVMDKLKNIITIKTAVYAVNIKDGPSLLFKEKTQAEETLDHYKKQYVNEGDYARLEKTGGIVPASTDDLGVDQIRTISVGFDKEVSIEEVTVTPEKVFDVEEAIQYLKTGVYEKKYKVASGETFNDVATRFNLTPEVLLSYNPGLVPETISEGQLLNIIPPQEPKDPLLKVVIEKETSKLYDVPNAVQVIDEPSMEKGNTQVAQEGSIGKKLSHQKITEIDGVEVSNEVIDEVVTVAPIDKIILNGVKVIPEKGDGEFLWPTNGGIITSTLGMRWGALHKGIDIAQPSNRTIKASDNGIVTQAGWQGGYGNKVTINHNNGFVTCYAHMASIDVTEGQIVSKGQAIGVMGTTGNSTGIHLHFEVYLNNELQNPLSYVHR